MHSEFLSDLALVMLVAGVVTIVFHITRQPVVLGYILAGFIVGPHTKFIPLMVHDIHTVEIMSSLGVVLLMFSLGLHFSLRKLAQVGKTAFIAAALEISVMVAAGYGIGRLFGWGTMDSLFLGAILSISSTTIIIKALGELKLVKEKFAELIFGILIVEDILAIAMLALLSGIAKSGTLAVGDVAATLGTLSVFLAAVLVVGLLAVPPLLRYVATFKSNEMLLVTALGLCFGVSLLAIQMGYSEALGAFIIGAIIAEARERGRIETLVEPVRDMFSAIFFVAIGMLIQPAMLWEHIWAILVITAVVVVGKVVTCSFGTFLAGHDPRTSVRVGMGLAQIGEFSFIIAALGLQLKVTSDFLYPIAVAVSAMTTLLTPYLIKFSDPLTAAGSRVVPEGVSAIANYYLRWINGSGTASRDSALVRSLLRKWAAQILLNMMLVTGVFLIAAWGGGKLKSWETSLPAWTGGTNAALWLGAMILSMPLLIVSFRKLRAVSLVLAEATVTKAAAKENTEALRGLFGGLVRVAGLVVLVLWVGALSIAIMPPWPVLVVLIIALAAAVATQRKSFEKVYGRAQIALHETFTTGSGDHDVPALNPDAPVAPVPTILQHAQLGEVIIEPDTPGSNKLIRELELRSRTGASAVGIERDGVSLVNPGPDEELLPGDRVVLLGSREQIEAAKHYLLGEPIVQPAPIVGVEG